MCIDDTKHEAAVEAPTGMAAAARSARPRPPRSPVERLRGIARGAYGAEARIGLDDRCGRVAPLRTRTDQSARFTPPLTVTCVTPGKCMSYFVQDGVLAFCLVVQADEMNRHRDLLLIEPADTESTLGRVEAKRPPGVA